MKYIEKMRSTSMTQYLFVTSAFRPRRKETFCSGLLSSSDS